MLGVLLIVFLLIEKKETDENDFNLFSKNWDFVRRIKFCSIFTEVYVGTRI